MSRCATEFTFRIELFSAFSSNPRGDPRVFIRGSTHESTWEFCNTSDPRSDPRTFPRGFATPVSDPRACGTARFTSRIDSRISFKFLVSKTRVSVIRDLRPADPCDFVVPNDFLSLLLMFPFELFFAPLLCFDFKFLFWLLVVFVWFCSPGASWTGAPLTES